MVERTDAINFSYAGIRVLVGAGRILFSLICKSMSLECDPYNSTDTLSEKTQTCFLRTFLSKPDRCVLPPRNIFSRMTTWAPMTKFGEKSADWLIPVPQQTCADQ